eukprot:165267_1
MNDVSFTKLVRNVFDQLGSVLVQYLPVLTIIDLINAQLFKQLNSHLTNRLRLSIYCNTFDIETRVELYNNAIQNSFNTIQKHDLKIWNIHIIHTLNTNNNNNNDIKNIPLIHDIIDIQQLLIYLCFISFTKQSNHLIPLCCDYEHNEKNENALIINININNNINKIKSFMNKIGNTFEHINEDQTDIIKDDFVDFGDDLACLDDIELIQKRALSLTSIISELEEDNKNDMTNVQDIENDEEGVKIYECSATDDDRAMNFDFKCHAIWKGRNNDFDSIKTITNNLPPTSHNKIQFDINSKIDMREIEFGNFYGDNNDSITFEFFDLLKKYIICAEFLNDIKWYGSDIEVSEVNEAIVKCYNMCFGLIRSDTHFVDNKGSYKLKFIVWKGLYKLVDELASLGEDMFMVD